VRHLLDGGSLFSSPSPPFPSFNGADIEDSTSPEEYSLFLLLKYIVYFYEYLVRQICFITSLVSVERQAAMSHHYFLFRTTTLDSSEQNYFFKMIYLEPLKCDFQKSSCCVTKKIYLNLYFKVLI